MNFVKRLREKYELNLAVKEALDGLPSAVCYFTEHGSVKLCNTAMSDIYRRMTGKELQSYAELKEVLKSSGDLGISRDGNIFLLPDGRALQYSEKEIRTEAGRQYRESVFSDVTDLYEKRRELETQSGEMKKMYAELQTLSGQLMEITREQEILNMKTRLHDQMNMGITSIRQILRQNTDSGENAAAIAKFRRAIEVLHEESSCPENELSEFIKDAEVAGVRVTVCGKMPEDREMRHLAIETFREACVNAARHGDASELTIHSDLTKNSVSLRITNNGRQPDREIVPRGGLADLRHRIRKAGGSLEIRSLPELELKVRLPVGQTEKSEET